MKTFGFRSLIQQFLLFLGALLLLSVLALVLIDRFVLMPALLEDEERHVAQELSQISASLVQNQKALLAATRDWAHWDDTYQFVASGHSTYSSANFSRGMFEDLGYQLMIFFNEHGEIHWIAGIDPASGQYGSCPRPTGECLWAAPAGKLAQRLLEDEPDPGPAYILSRPWPAMAAVSSIHPTDGSGPARGWLVQMRLLDSRLTGALQEQTGLAITVRPGAPESTEETGLAIERHKDTLQAQWPLPTHASGPPLSLLTSLPRERFHIGVQTFRYSLAWTSALLLTVILLVVLLLAVLVIRPLTLLTGFTRDQQGAYPGRSQTSQVPVALLERHDEFGVLARHLQDLIDYQSHQAGVLRRLSEQDPLTSLANRRVFDTRLGQMLRDDPERELAVMMIDIDHFKPFNDHYGHQEGDKCLVSVSQRMQDTLQPNGFLLARTGGEEFSVLMPGVPLDEACGYAERLRQQVMALAILHPHSAVADVITISIGVSSTADAGNRSPSALMRRADLALYEAKADGRNRVSASRRPRGSTVGQNP